MAASTVHRRTCSASLVDSALEPSPTSQQTVANTSPLSLCQTVPPQGGSDSPLLAVILTLPSRLFETCTVSSPCAWQVWPHLPLLRMSTCQRAKTEPSRGF